jgi:hypothetical protein
VKSPAAAGARSAAVFALLSLVVAALNVSVAARLFTKGWLVHFNSVEGFFVALARLLARSPEPGWWPYWYAGMPFYQVYVPALHQTAALVSSLGGLPPVNAYHVVTATGYALGPVALMLAMRSLGAATPACAAAAVIVSLTSPSLLFMPGFIADTGGVQFARRLQVLTVYGEGPHVVSLALQFLCLAALQWFVAHRRRQAFLLSALLFALLVAVNLPGAMAFFVLLAAWVLAQPAVSGQFGALRAALMVGVAGYLLAAYFVPPQTLLTARETSAWMHPGFTNHPWLRTVLTLWLLAAMWLLNRWLCRRQFTLAARFGIVASLLLVLIAATAGDQRFELLPQAGRLHLEAEFALAIALGLALAALFAKLGARARLAFGLLLAGCLIVQFQHYRAYARRLIQPADLSRRSEWRTASWLQANLPGERIYATGSTAFWLNAFADNPQLGGCCDQSVTSPYLRAIPYLVNLAQTPEEVQRAVLWLRAFGVRALVAPGAASTEVYPDIRHPGKFRSLLPVLAGDTGDIIYDLGAAAARLAAVIPQTALVRQPPEGLSDTAAVSAYVQAASAGGAESHWRSPATLALLARQVQTGDVVSVRVSAHPGWRASMNGAPVPASADALGFLVLRPPPCTACRIHLEWSPPPALRAIRALSLAAWLAWGALALTLLLKTEPAPAT